MLEQTERIFNDLALIPSPADRDYQEAAFWNSEVFSWSNQVAKLAISCNPKERLLLLNRGGMEEVSEEECE